MRAPLHNIPSARLTKAAPMLIPMALMPLVMVGVTALPTADVMEAQERLEEVRDQLEVHEERVSELSEFGAYGEVATVEALTEEIRSLIPRSLSDLELFSAARIAARQSGIELSSVQIIGTQDLEISMAGRPLATRDSRIQGTGTLDRLVLWVDQLRALGVPCAVRRFTVSRSAPDDTTFRFEIVLGAFHYLPEPLPEE